MGELMRAKRPGGSCELNVKVCPVLSQTGSQPGRTAAMSSIPRQVWVVLAPIRMRALTSRHVHDKVSVTRVHVCPGPLSPHSVHPPEEPVRRAFPRAPRLRGGDVGPATSVCATRG